MSIPYWALIIAAVLIAVGIAFGAIPAIEHMNHPDPNACWTSMGFVCE